MADAKDETEPPHELGSHPDMLAVLTAAPDHERRLPAARLTKTYTFDGGAWDQTSAGAKGTWFTHEWREVGDLHALAHLLRALEGRPHSAVVRGALARPVSPGTPIRRLKARRRDNPEALWVECERRWVMVDIDDGLEAPDALDWSNPETWPEVLRGVCARLGAPFARAGCVAQWSASAGGVKPGLRVHLWFLLDTPVCDDALKAWAKGVVGAWTSGTGGAPVDAALYQSQQLHFCATPLFRGASDPLPMRTIVLDGPRLEVGAVESWCGASEWEQTRARPRRASTSTSRAPSRPRAVPDDAEVASVLEALGFVTKPEKPDKKAYDPDDKKKTYDPDKYDDWLAVGMILHHGFAGEERGFALWSAWSEGSAWCQGRFDEAVAREKWEDFGKNVSDAEAVGLGTLFLHAREQGWRGVTPSCVRASRIDLEHPSRRYDEDAKRVELGEARAELGRIYLEALRDTGAHYVTTTMGVGKTTALLEVLACELHPGPDDDTVLDDEDRILFVTPDHTTEGEVLERMREALEAREASLHVGSALDAMLRPAPVRTSTSCPELDTMNALRHVAPDAVGAFCGQCWRNPKVNTDRASWCPFWLARRTRGARFEVMTHARAIIGLEAGEWDDYTVVCWDEAPVDAMVQPLTLTADGVFWSAQALEFPTQDVVPLAEALTSGADLSGEQLRDLMRDFPAPPKKARRVELLDAALKDTRAQLAVKCVASDLHEWASVQPDYRAVEALAQLAQGGWINAHVRGRQLHTKRVVRIEDAPVDTMIVLDGTGTRRLARAVLGDDVVYHGVRVDLPETCDVVRVDYDMGSRTQFGEARHLEALVWGAAHSMASAPRESFHSTHKRYRAGDHAVARACEHLEAQGAHLNHFLGAGTIGYDGARHCTTAVLDTFHLPTHEVESLAHVFATMGGVAPDDDESRASWGEEALHHARGRVIAQTAHRVRPVRASEHRPVTLVLLGTQDTTAFGLPARRVVRVAELLWERWGILQGDGGEDVGARLLREAVEGAGGVWAPRREHTLTLGDLWTPPDDPSGVLAIIGADHLDHLNDQRARPLRTALEALGGPWEEWAQRAGVGLAYAYDGEAGAPTPLLHTEGLELGDVLAAAPAWCVAVARTPGGERVERRVELELGDVLDAINLLDGAPLSFQGMRVRVREALGCSFRHAEQWIKAQGGVDALCEAWLLYRGERELQRAPLFDHNARPRAPLQVALDVCDNLERRLYEQDPWEDGEVEQPFADLAFDVGLETIRDAAASLQGFSLPLPRIDLLMDRAFNAWRAWPGGVWWGQACEAVPELRGLPTPQGWDEGKAWRRWQALHHLRRFEHPPHLEGRLPNRPAARRAVLPLYTAAQGFRRFGAPGAMPQVLGALALDMDTRRVERLETWELPQDENIVFLPPVEVEQDVDIHWLLEDFTLWPSWASNEWELCEQAHDEVLRERQREEHLATSIALRLVSGQPTQAREVELEIVRIWSCTPIHARTIRKRLHLTPVTLAVVARWRHHGARDVYNMVCQAMWSQGSVDLPDGPKYTRSFPWASIRAQLQRFVVEAILANRPERLRRDTLLCHINTLIAPFWVEHGVTPSRVFDTFNLERAHAHMPWHPYPSTPTDEADSFALVEFDHVWPRNVWHAVAGLMLYGGDHLPMPGQVPVLNEVHAFVLDQLDMGELRNLRPLELNTFIAGKVGCGDEEASRLRRAWGLTEDGLREVVRARWEGRGRAHTRLERLAVG